MSLFRMTQRAISIAPAEGPAAATAPSDGARAALERIVDYIPSEVIAIYIAGFSILQPTTDLEKWIVFAIAALLVPVFVGSSLVAIRRGTSGSVQLSLGKGIGLSILSWLAYTTWTAAIPESPFVSLHPNANRYAAFVALILSYLIPKIAKRFGLDVNSRYQEP